VKVAKARAAISLLPESKGDNPSCRFSQHIEAQGNKLKAVGGAREASVKNRTAECNKYRHPVQRYADTECNVMPSLDWLPVSVQNLIHAEDVRGRFELGQNSVFKELPEPLVREADIHDKSLSSGARLSVALRRAGGCFTERVHHFAVVPLGAVPARNAEPDIHSLYPAVETVTED
jgi:hypothetical protein